DLISLHPYFAVDSSRFGDPDMSGADLVTRTQAIAGASGKQVYVGEYGQMTAGTHACGGAVGQACGGVDPTRASTRRMTAPLVAAGVAYSALFAYESAPLDPMCPRDLSCGTADGDPIIDYLVTRPQASGPITPPQPTTVVGEWHFDTSPTILPGW